VLAGHDASPLTQEEVMSHLVLSGSDVVDAALSTSAPAGPAQVSPSLGLVQTGPVPPQRRRTDRGLVSAEWAMAIIAAVTIVGVLVAVISTGVVKSLLGEMISAIIRTFLKAI
jgi:hypothetical protein